VTLLIFEDHEEALAALIAFFITMSQSCPGSIFVQPG
jgi:hypothetical protein